MSIRKALGRSATRSKPSLSRPTGLGVWKVPSASQRSCQASSICWASAGVYRCGGTPSADGSVLWLAVWLMVGCSQVLVSGAVDRKKPLTQEGSPCCSEVSGQHGGRSRSPPVTQPSVPCEDGRH